MLTGFAWLIRIGDYSLAARRRCQWDSPRPWHGGRAHLSERMGEQMEAALWIVAALVVGTIVATVICLWRSRK